MYSATKSRLAGGVLMGCAVAAVLLFNAKMPAGAAQDAQSGVLQRLNLGERLAAGKLRTVNREVAKLQGSRDGVHVAEKTGTRPSLD